MDQHITRLICGALFFMGGVLNLVPALRVGSFWGIVVGAALCAMGALYWRKILQEQNDEKNEK